MSSTTASSLDLYAPNLGSTIFSVTKVPNATIKNVDANMKNQFEVGCTK